MRFSTSLLSDRRRRRPHAVTQEIRWLSPAEKIDAALGRITGPLPAAVPDGARPAEDVPRPVFRPAVPVAVTGPMPVLSEPEPAFREPKPLRDITLDRPALDVMRRVASALRGPAAPVPAPASGEEAGVVRDWLRRTPRPRSFAVDKQDLPFFRTLTVEDGWQGLHARFTPPAHQRWTTERWWRQNLALIDAQVNAARAEAWNGGAR